MGIDHHRRAAEGDRGDGGGGIVADARQRAQPCLAVGKAPAMIAHHGTRAGEQVAGAGIIAEPRPRRHHIGIVGRRKVGDGRPALGEALEIARDRRDGRLLEHDFGEPDAIGIGHRAAERRDAPRQVARRAVVPAEQAGGETVWALDAHPPPMAWRSR